MTKPSEGRQTVMFSATFPKEIQAMAQAFQNKDLVRVEVGVVGSTTTNITQQVGRRLSITHPPGTPLQFGL